MLLRAVLLSILTLLSSPVSAQSVLSTHSGLIHFFEGPVSVDGQAVSPVNGRFQQIPEGGVLETNAGRAEILLGPELFLWLAPNSSVKMLRNSLDDIRVELLSGTAIVRSAELLPDNAVTLVQHDAAVRLSPKGFYRLDAASSALTIVNGEATLTLGTDNLVVNQPRRVLLLSGAIDSIPKTQPDALDLWVKQRRRAISEFNQHSNRTVASANPEKGKRSRFGRLGPILPPFPHW
jgi:hypothetical protein